MSRQSTAAWGLGLLLLLAAPSAKAAPPPLEAYGRLPAIERISLSPSGHYLISVGDVGGKRYVLVRTLSGDVVFSTEVGAVKVRGAKWVDDSHVLVTISRTDWDFDRQDREEYFFDFCIDVVARKSWILFDKDPRFVPMYGSVLATYQINGKPYAFAANTPMEGMAAGSLSGNRSDLTFGRSYPDLWRVDLTNGDLKRVAQGSPDILTWVVGADGEVVAYANFFERTSEFRLMRGMSQILYRRSPRLETELLGQGRSPGSTLVFDQTGDKSRLIEIEADNSIQTLVEGENVTSAFHSPITGLLEGIDIDDSTIRYFDPDRQARIDAATKPFHGRIEVESATDSLDKVVLHTDGPGDSGTYYLVDLTAHRADIIDNTYPEVPPDQVGEVREFAYKASDGLALDGVLTLPPGRPARSLPIVVMPHGGPFDDYDRVQFDWMAQAFASRGYAVFQPNYRGSGGRGAAFRNAGFGEYGRGMINDVRDGLHALAEQGLVDPKRACIVGFSYGGYAALAGVTLQQGLYRCAIDGAGVSDPALMLQWHVEHNGLGAIDVKFLKQAMGVDQKDAPSLAEISPLRFAARADAPILIIHGKDDSVVPIQQTLDMAAALKAAGKSVETILTEGGDHWMSSSATRTQTLKAAVAFVEKHNPAD